MPKRSSNSTSFPDAADDDNPTLDDDTIDWYNLAASQGKISKEAIVSQTDGHVFALEDRSSHAHTSWRRVLVRVQRAKNEMHVFGAEGSIISDSSKNVCHGRQAIDMFFDQFEPSGKQLYRSPQIRTHPRDRRATQSNVVISGSSSAKVSSVSLCSRTTRAHTTVTNIRACRMNFNSNTTVHASV